MIIVDANILVSSIAGQHTRRVVADALTRGLLLSTPLPQAIEAAHVLEIKLGYASADTHRLLGRLLQAISLLEINAFAAYEAQARARLHQRAQSDWPIVAAAMALGGEIWSNDRDYFGIGIAVWSTKNIAYAA